MPLPEGITEGFVSVGQHRDIEIEALSFELPLLVAIERGRQTVFVPEGESDFALEMLDRIQSLVKVLE